MEAETWMEAEMEIYESGIDTEDPYDFEGETRLSNYHIAIRADTRGEPYQLNALNDEDTWELFLKKVRLPDSKQVQFSNVLALSYNNLPFHLRPCFLYLRLFPKDYDIPVRRLLRLWLAEGFVKQTPGMTPEDTMEIYLEELTGLGNRIANQLVVGANLTFNTIKQMIGWTDWAKVAIVPGLVSLIVGVICNGSGGMGVGF
ncbi:putative late blight resistance protein like protein r1b-12 [Quercus suber]|uniref:Late blight resistance protein like protein r1b-12 n=1 Tax=Quercus suber TaxID=58331 RepID=A0AAW0J9G1_QUESU